VSSSIAVLPRRRPLRGAIWYVPVLVAGLVAARLGVGTVGLILLGLLIVATLLPLRASVWAGAAVGAAILMRTLTAGGALPSVMDFADFGLVYAGLAAVMIRRGGAHGTAARGVGLGLLLLMIAIGVSWAFHLSNPVRPLFAYTLWAEPFVLVLVLLAEPPTRREQRVLLTWFAALLAIQLPIAVYQAVTISVGDPVQGTLQSPGGGSHVLAGIEVLGGIALITYAFSRSFLRGIGAMLLAAPLLIGIPIITDAKQVTFALPFAGLALVVAVRGLASKIALAVPPAVAVLVLVLFVPAGKGAVAFLQNAESGRSGKLVGLHLVQNRLGDSLSGWAFGLGPANGLSRAAYLTDPGFLRSDSPVRLLGLKPAPLPPVANIEAALVASGTSFNNPLSSAIGVLSDTGVVGLAAFGAMIGAATLPLWRRRRLWLAQAALAGWAMSIPLAVTFDWWEEPPFMLSLALLTGLAIVWTPRDANSSRADLDVPGQRPSR
jgi:hypothetical protein